MRASINFLFGAVVMSLVLAWGMEYRRRHPQEKKAYAVCNLDATTGAENCGKVYADSYQMTPSGCAMFPDETTWCHITRIQRVPEGQ